MPCLRRSLRISLRAGIVTLPNSNARFRNPRIDRHMRFQCLTGAGGAAPKVEIGDNCANVTSPCGAVQPDQVGRKGRNTDAGHAITFLCGADVGSARDALSGRHAHSTGQAAGLSQRAFVHLGRPRNPNDR